MLNLVSVVQIGTEYFTNVESVDVDRNSRVLIDIASVKLAFNNRLTEINKKKFEIKKHCKIYAGYEKTPNMRDKLKSWCVGKDKLKISEYYNGREKVKTELDLQGSNIIYDGVISDVSIDENVVHIMLKDRIWLTQSIKLEPKVYKKKINIVDIIKEKYEGDIEVDEMVKPWLEHTSYTIGNGATVFTLLDQIFYLTSAHIFYKDDKLVINGSYNNKDQAGAVPLSSIWEEGYTPYESFSLDETVDLKKTTTLIIKGGGKTVTEEGTSGETSTTVLPNTMKASTELKTYAKDIQRLRTQRDNRSELMCWLYPFVKPNDYVKLKKYYLKRDDSWTAEKGYDNPETSVHYVPQVRTSISASGGVQTITIESRLNV